MNPRRYCIAVTLLCACGAVNVVFYVLENAEVLERRTDTRDGSYRREPLYDNLKSSRTKYLQEDDVTTRGDHSIIRKLNHIKQVESENSRLFEFTINEVEICGDLDGRKNTIVIVVPSSVRNFLRRDTIRNTWGSVVRDMNGTILFLVGRTSDSRLQHQVVKESELYSDIVQVDILDTYQNLTLKSIAILQWLVDYCTNSKFYLKADDDVYVNVPNVIKALNERQEHEFFLCYVFKKAPPLRNPNSKWYVSYDHYPGKVFPTYCSGTAYAFSSDIISDLYLSSLKAKMCVMEDVFITGLSAEGKNFTHIHHNGFSYLKRIPTGCAYTQALTGHEVSIKHMYVIFSQLLSNDYDCRTETNLGTTKLLNTNVTNNSNVD